MINRLVVHFLSSPSPTAHPSWTQLAPREARPESHRNDYSHPGRRPANPNPESLPPVTARHSPARGPDWWLMMKAFFRHGRKIASFAPSSRFMARKIIDGIDWDQAKCIVELGAGTGPITAEIVKRVEAAHQVSS